MFTINHDAGNLLGFVDETICKYKFHPSLAKVSWKIGGLFRFNPYQNKERQSKI